MLTRDDFIIRPMPVVYDGEKETNLYTPQEWAEKVYEEVDEALEAEATESALRTVEEVIDVMTVCASWLNAMGIDKESIDDMIRYVNNKNRTRGYTKAGR